MFKVTILNSAYSEHPWQASFATEQEAQEWLSKQKTKPHRLDERVVPISDEYAPEDVLETIETEVEQFDEQGNSLGMQLMQTHVRLKAQAVYSIEDVSAQIASQAQKDEALKFLQESDWKVLRHRDQLEAGITPSLSNEQYQALLVERQTKRDLI